jgi:hypothetical protein
MNGSPACEPASSSVWPGCTLTVRMVPFERTVMDWTCQAAGFGVPPCGETYRSRKMRRESTCRPAITRCAADMSPSGPHS